MGIQLLDKINWDKKNLAVFKKALPSQATSKIRILQYELNWSFRYGQDYCLDKIKSLGVDLGKLARGNCFAFVNAKRDRVRLLTLDENGRAISIMQAMPKGEYMEVRALKHLPLAFNGPQLDMDAATSKFLDVFFAGKRKRKSLLGVLKAAKPRR